MLNIGDVMGYVEIPKINVNLPIYQGDDGRSAKSSSWTTGRIFTTSRGRKYAYSFNWACRGLPSALICYSFR